MEILACPPFRIILMIFIVVYGFLQSILIFMEAFWRISIGVVVLLLSASFLLSRPPCLGPYINEYICLNKGKPSHVSIFKSNSLKIGSWNLVFRPTQLKPLVGCTYRGKFCRSGGWEGKEWVGWVYIDICRWQREWEWEGKGREWRGRETGKTGVYKQPTKYE